MRTCCEPFVAYDLKNTCTKFQSTSCFSFFQEISKREKYQFFGRELSTVSPLGGAGVHIKKATDIISRTCRFYMKMKIGRREVGELN